MPTTVPASHRDLLSAPVGSLTTIGADGGPQATLTWFVFDEADGHFKLSLNTDRLKTKNLRKRPQVSLLIPDPANPMRFMDVRGHAHAEPDPDYAWAVAHVNPKYGADVREFDAPGSERLIVTIEPRNIYAVEIPG
ncbi:PPOX class F420-dependent oxidoreductase [Conexibacter sp. DBS9H8]|uniref:PPOX class F420-dependent oxidoreductase n=1 Tax=Conexibacter sp. DBS9H8 TaxID=2937801 RepID=UPI00200F9B2B|nr:PPOX class F420-dependent oxidoreductase [Conexibacter sp. DBS9H8]